MKETHYLLPLALLLCLLAGACQQDNRFHVEGCITGARDSVLHFEANTIGGVKELATKKLTEAGGFDFDAERPECPEFFILRIGDRRIHLSADSTERITVRADYATMATDYQVEGSEASERIRQIIAGKQQLQRQLIDIERNDRLLPGVMRDSLLTLLSEYKLRMMNDYILADPWSGAAYFAVCQQVSDLGGSFFLFNPLYDRADVKCYAAVATAWDGRWPDAPRTEQLCNMAIKGMENTAPVTQHAIELDEDKITETGIIDIELPDINGDLRRLSDLRGKVVILDFTLYGAEQSPKRTRLMRDLYEKYKGRGLEIYQVSLDDDTHFWQFSCEKLPWVCVHETDGTATGLYAVRNLPTFFLINRQNEVVKRSDFVDNLEQELEALL